MKTTKKYIYIFLFRYSGESLCSTLPNESSFSIDATNSQHDEDVNSSYNNSTALPYSFVVKDSIIRNSVLVKLEKKKRWLKVIGTPFAWEYMMIVQNILSKYIEIDQFLIRCHPLMSTLPQTESKINFHICFDCVLHHYPYMSFISSISWFWRNLFLLVKGTLIQIWRSLKIFVLV